jgi:hypothetical protein
LNREKEHTMLNTELNRIGTGAKWGLWNLLPLVGTIIVTIRILNLLFATTGKKVGMFIALIIPYVNIAGCIVFMVLIVKRIGGKFLVGYLLVPVALMAALSLSAVSVYHHAREKKMESLRQME